MALQSPHLTSRLLVFVVLLGSVMATPPTTLADAAQAPSCFTETNHCIDGRFRGYWLANGGLAQFGFPLTDEHPELLEDGNAYTVQYFERARFEKHPENQAPYDVLLGQFGRRVLGGLYRGNVEGYQQAIAPVMPTGEGQFFAATGHAVKGRFLDYWRSNGGLAQFGFPLAEERTDKVENEQEYTVQYFERARFEYHPENVSPNDILLGQFGRQVAADNALLDGDFRTLYLTNEAVRLQLGRPITARIQSPGALQPFERGRMYYDSLMTNRLFDGPIIYVLCGTAERGRIVLGTFTGAYTGAFPDTWTEGQDPGGGPAPTPGLFYPQRGFGKVWREHPEVQQCLGYATTATEIGFPMTAQLFGGGVLLLSDTPEGRFIYLLHVWRSCNSCAPAGTYERFAAQTP